MDDPLNLRCSSAAVQRNRDPILTVLRRIAPSAGRVLELASGTGEHAVYFAGALPGLQWQPTDPSPEARDSITAWMAHGCPANLLPPLFLDASAGEWPVEQADMIVAINMVHISPWSATEGLFAGSARLLPTQAPVLLYGPFVEDDLETAPSNLAFDADLRARNADWGLRNRDEVAALASSHGFTLAERIAMPANNLALIFRKI